MRRHTCSPVTRRSTRARQAQAAPGAHAGQSAPKIPSKRATRLATGPRSAWTARWQVGREHCLSRNVIKRHDLASRRMKHCLVTPLKSRSRGTRMGTTAANRHLRCPVHPRPRALRPARALVCARPRVCARPHHQARARRTRATRRHDAQNSPKC